MHCVTRVNVWLVVNIVIHVHGEFAIIFQMSFDGLYVPLPCRVTVWLAAVAQSIASRFNFKHVVSIALRR